MAFIIKVKPFKELFENVRILINELALMICMISVYLVKSDNLSIPNE